MPSDFHTTRWSRVSRAADPAHPEHRRALAELCRNYWRPVYRFVLGKVGDRHEAEARTQEFFARLLEGERFGRADRERGRFRTWLLTSVSGFLVDERRREGAQKRGGGVEFVSIEHQPASLFELPDAGATPEQLFEDAWRHELVHHARERVRQAELAKHGDVRWSALSRWIFESPEPGDYARVGEELGRPSSTVASVVARWRDKLERELKAEVAELREGGEERHDA